MWYLTATCCCPAVRRGALKPFEEKQSGWFSVFLQALSFVCRGMFVSRHFQDGIQFQSCRGRCCRCFRLGRFGPVGRLRLQKQGDCRKLKIYVGSEGCFRFLRLSKTGLITLSLSHRSPVLGASESSERVPDFATGGAPTTGSF